jgi:hypothetical protein
MTRRAQPVNAKYQRIRHALALKCRKTIPRWAADRGYPVSTVYDAAKGTRKGPESLNILKELEAYL